MGRHVADRRLWWWGSGTAPLVPALREFVGECWSNKWEWLRLIEKEFYTSRISLLFLNEYWLEFVVFCKMGFIYTYKRGTDFCMEVRDDITVVIADGVE